MESAATIHAGSGESERAERSRWSYWRFRIFLAAWVLYAAYYFCRKNFSVVMPMMARTSHYNNFDLAHAVFVFSLAYAAGQFVSGALGDRFGGRLGGKLRRIPLGCVYRRHGDDVKLPGDFAVADRQRIGPRLRVDVMPQSHGRMVRA